jgi:hypothetical protein
VDAGQYFTAVLKPTVVIAVIAVVQGDGVVRLEWDGESLERWKHRPDIVEAALLRSGGIAEWRPGWHVLIVPPAVLANERNVFSLAALDERTECSVGASAPA